MRSSPAGPCRELGTPFRAGLLPVHHLHIQLTVSSGQTPSSGLCAATNNPLRNQTDFDHPLRNLTEFYHTPWLDRAFCSYPNRVHSVLPDSAQECLPTNTFNTFSVLRNLSSICDMAPGTRSRQTFRRLRLPFCSEYTVDRVFGDFDDCVISNSTEDCRDCIRNIYLIDQHVKFVYCHFVQDILARFDCETPFSVQWKCTDCQTAYRRWLCSMMIPFRMGVYRIRPCREFCTMVERKCPYLTPDDKVIIAGEPMFFCKDPDIPELYSAYEDAPHCYLPCHLNVTAEEKSAEPQEDCARHKFLNEELAIFYNMSRRRSSGSTRSLFFSPLLLLTVMMHFLGVKELMLF